MTTVDCYFDYVSPFSYLLHEQLYRLPPDTSVNHVPVLFAGLLKYWGNLGPVEIERKRLFTYRHTTWLADQLGVPFRMPDTHPFNPLPFLRLTIAVNCDSEVISTIYQSIWIDGDNPVTEDGKRAILSKTGVEDAASLVNEPQVKATLKLNTDRAIEGGIYGVPTMIADGELFWGLDSLDLLIDYLQNRDLFESNRMRRLENLHDTTQTQN